MGTLQYLYFKSQYMKKVVALIAMLSLAFFASCSTEETNVEVEAGTEVEAPMVEETEAPMTDTEGNEVDEEAAEAAAEAEAVVAEVVAEAEVTEEATEEMAK